MSHVNTKHDITHLKSFSVFASIHLEAFSEFVLNINNKPHQNLIMTNTNLTF